MTHPPDDHIDDLLPAWLNGTLPFDVQERVRSHLDHCAACRAEVEEWEAIARATRAFAEARLIEGGQVSGGIWAASHSSGESINASDRRGDLAERSAQEPHILRSAKMTDTLSGSTTSRSIAIPNGPADAFRQSPRRGGSWLSQVFPTLTVMALLVVLVGGVYVREFGFPTITGGGDLHQLPALSSSPDGSSPTTLSCDSPGYRPVINGEVDEDALAAIGITEVPLNFDGEDIHIPTSTGEIVTLDTGWTPIGGPMWSTTSGTIPATIKNIETGEEWTSPVTNIMAGGMYFPPYLVLPENQVPTDFRIIDTITGDDMLVSELRGGEFTGQTYISQIGIDYDSSIWPVPAPIVLLFSEAPYQPAFGVGDPPTDTEPNVLILPAELEDATFVPDPADAEFFHETAYAPATDQIAYSTEIDGQRAIVVIQPGTDSRVVLQHPDFAADVLPLMFSTDGSKLVATQPGAIFTFELNGTEVSDAKVLSTFEDQVMPIAHNAESMNVLVQYPDKHIAFVNALSGNLTEYPDVIVPASEFPSSNPDQRLSFETDIYELFDEAAGTVRFVNLGQETITPELQVMNPEADTISAAFQPEFQYVVRYPYTSWPGGYAYLDVSETLQVVSTDTGVKSWSVPPPAGFELDANDVAWLFRNPAGTCLVLQVVTSTDLADGGTSRSEYLATWVLPLDPNAEWTELDVQLTGWFAIYESAEETLDAPDFATPVATPASTIRTSGARK